MALITLLFELGEFITYDPRCFCREAFSPGWGQPKRVQHLQ
jgi:hypothetical protein